MPEATTTSQLFALLLMEASVALCRNTAMTDLYIICMLPHPVQKGATPTWLATRNDGADIAPAVHLAVNQINSRTDLLSNYTLHVIEGDGACDVRARTYASFVQILHKTWKSKKIVGIIGPACSDSALAIASLTTNNHVPAVSLHLGIDPTLGQYPYAFGVIGSSVIYGKAILELMKYNGWNQVNILYSTASWDYFSAYKELRKTITLSELDIDLSLPVSKAYIPLKTLKNSKTRIIVAFTELDISLQVMCIAYHAGLTFPAFQWVFVNRLVVNFSESHTDFLFESKKHYSNCSDKEMEEATDGVISLFVNLQVDNRTHTFTGQSYSKYIIDYKQSMKQHSKRYGFDFKETLWANPAYDATWALALALNATNMPISRCSCNTVAKLVTENLYKLNFTGVSGTMSFENNSGFSDRTLKIYQFKNGFDHVVGHYSNGKGLVFTESLLFISSEFEIEIEEAPRAVAVCMIVFFALPLLLTIFTHVISLVYHQYPPIMASSYKLNQLAYLGYYIFMYGLAVFAVRETGMTTLQSSDVFCISTTWSEAIGMSLLLGTVCMKCWRLHEIQTKAEALKRTSRTYLLWDSTLAFGVLMLVLPEIVLQVVRTVFDRPQWKVVTHKVSESPHVTKVSYGCMGENNTSTYWFCAEVGYKSLLVICAFWLAHNSRKMEEKGFHMKYVIVFVYVFTFATCCVFLPVVLIFTTSETPEFGFVVIIIVGVYFATLLYGCATLLFLPPVIALVRGKWKSKFHEKSFWSRRPNSSRRIGITNRMFTHN